MKGEKIRSPYESLRIEGSVRAAIIGYGLAGVTLILSRSSAAQSASFARQALYMLITGLVLQALLFVVRALTARYEHAAGLEGYLSPLVIYIFEITVDAVTVFLFAWGTYRGLLAYTTEI